MSQATPTRHAIHWFELPVRSIDRTQPFYEEMLGLKLKRENFGGADMVYLNAEPSLDAALQRVEAVGGRILTPRQELPPGMGCFAHVSDPEGRRVGLHAQS
jgi:predicted enzyme related to lactoylglutathione lyase